MKERNGSELSKAGDSREDLSGNSASEINENVSDEQKSSSHPEILEKMPSEARKILEVGMSMHRFDPTQNPLTEKLNEKHIDKILELSADSEERSFREMAQSRRFALIYAVIFAALFVFVTIFLVRADTELYKEILKLFAVFLGGLGGGFGVKSYMDRGKGG